MGELQQELLDYAKRRYQSERQELLSLIDLKAREVEEFRQRMLELEAQTEKLEDLLRREQELRMEDLAKHETELLELQKRFGREKNITRDELDAAQAVISRLTEQGAAYKKEIKQLAEDHEKELEAAQKDLAGKEMQLESMRLKERDLETKMASIEGAAREEKEKLLAKVHELEQHLAKERESRKTLELEAKNALSLSTASMLEGRAEMGALKEHSSMLSARVKELEAEKAKVIDDWQAERRKWEEMWLRERAVWESQMLQSKDAGARSIKERAQWEGMLRSKEAKEIRLTKMLSTFLAELNRWKDAFQIPTELSIPGMTREREEEPAAAPVKSGKRKWILAASLGIFVLCAGGGALLWKISARPILFAQTEAWELSIPTPSGIARDPKQPNVLWITDWKSGEIIQVSKSDPSQELVRFKPSLTFFHPNSIAFSPDGAHLFSLDSVSHKIYMHSAEDPSKVLQEFTAPSPASLFLAASSGELAVLDTIEKKLFLYTLKDMSAKPAVFQLPKEISPAAMNAGKEIWIADAKESRILRFANRSSGWKQSGAPISLKLGPEFPGVSSLSGFLPLEVSGELMAVFEGEPGKLVLLAPTSSK